MSDNAVDAEAALTHRAAHIDARQDRRVRRTRNVLGDALLALMCEKGFDDVTVQDVLDRAGIARSTFYAHYRDKNDLFLSDVEDFLHGFATFLTRTRASPRRLAPIAEFFGHVQEQRALHHALVASGQAGDVLSLGRGYFARSIEARLRLACVHMEPVSRTAQAHALSGSMFALLDWWIGRGMLGDPRQMDALFHQMAWTGLDALHETDERSCAPSVTQLSGG